MLQQKGSRSSESGGPGDGSWPDDEGGSGPAGLRPGPAWSRGAVTVLGLQRVVMILPRSRGGRGRCADHVDR